MPGKAHATRDHQTIRRWVEERGGKPAVVSSTKGGKGGILRIDFPGYSGSDSLEEISWERFFEVFDQKKLALLYQTKTRDGEQSRFCKLVYAKHAEDVGEDSPPEHIPDYHSHVTTDPDIIRVWCEERGGMPAIVAATRGQGSGGILRIDFPGYSGEETLEQVSWEEFFDVFSRNELAFLYQDETKSGEQSRFCRFIAEANADES